MVLARSRVKNSNAFPADVPGSQFPKRSWFEGGAGSWEKMYSDVGQRALTWLLYHMNRERHRKSFLYFRFFRLLHRRIMERTFHVAIPTSRSLIRSSHQRSMPIWGKGWRLATLSLLRLPSVPIQWWICIAAERWKKWNDLISSCIVKGAENSGGIQSAMIACSEAGEDEN